MRSLLTAAVLTAGVLATSAAPTAAQTVVSAPASIPSCRYMTDLGHTFAFCPTGPAATLNVPPGATWDYTFGYPGDSSDITITARLSPVDSGNPNASGFNVYDGSRPEANAVPVEMATIGNNQLANVADTLQFNYSSGTAGAVTLQAFNLSARTVSFSIDDSGLQEPLGVTVPVTLQLAAGAGATPGVTSTSVYGCAFYEGMQLFVNRADSSGRRMSDIVGPCTQNEYSDSTGNVLQHTTNGLLVYEKPFNRIDYTDGMTTWYGCTSGIIHAGLSAVMTCN